MRQLLEVTQQSKTEGHAIAINCVDFIYMHACKYRWHSFTANDGPRRCLLAAKTQTLLNATVTAS